MAHANRFKLQTGRTVNRPTRAYLTLLTLFAHGMAIAEPVQGTVIDSTGVEIGALGNNGVLAKINSTVVFIPLKGTTMVGDNGKTWTDPTRFVPQNGSETLHFADLDCKGKSFVTFRSVILGATPAATVADGQGGGTVYIGTVSFPVNRQMQSRLNGSFGPPLCFNANEKVPTVPLAATVDLGSLYVAPYSLK